MSHAEKDALILALLAQLAAADERIAAQDARIAALEARLGELSRPPKTPDNSSKPPSQGQKSDCPAPGDRPPRKSRPGVGRTLHPTPDRIVEARLTTCPNCEAAFPDSSQTPQQVYERIELPPIRPDVTQVRLFGGRCTCCGERVTAEAPAGRKQGSPFGQSIAAMVVYLHYAHAIGMERLVRLMDELFSLAISEGAISNILARAREPLLAATAAGGGLELSIFEIGDRGPARRATIDTNHSLVNAVSFNDRGDWLAAVNNAGRVWLWRMKESGPDPEPLTLLEGDRKQGEKSIAFGRAGVLVAALGDGGCAAWNLKDGFPKPIPIDCGTPSSRVLFNSDGGLLAVGGRALSLYSVSDDGIPTPISQEPAREDIRQLAWSADSRWIAAAYGTSPVTDVGAHPGDLFWIDVWERAAEGKLVKQDPRKSAQQVAGPRSARSKRWSPTRPISAASACHRPAAAATRWKSARSISP